MAKATEKIVIRHNGKGNAEVIRAIYTVHGKVECMIAPNVDWKDGDKIVKALSKP